MRQLGPKLPPAIERAKAGKEAEGRRVSYDVEPGCDVGHRNRCLRAPGELRDAPDTREQGTRGKESERGRWGNEKERERGIKGECEESIRERPSEIMYTSKMMATMHAMGSEKQAEGGVFLCREPIREARDRGYTGSVDPISRYSFGERCPWPRNERGGAR